jgi:hypothetical protein
MHKLIRIAVISFTILSISAAIIFYRYGARSEKIEIYTGDCFCIPQNCKNLALLGCTPNPTNYLKEQTDIANVLQTITLDDFLDIDYLQDSFDQTFALCKEHGVDHLLLAYLPIYYIGMHELLGNQFVSGCRIFLNRIIKNIAPIIEKCSANSGFKGKITLIIPMDYQLARVPLSITGIGERIRYLIKQFPKLKNITESSLETITIINTQESAENDMLINYLQYEYLYEKPVAYKKCNISKERFHGPKKELICLSK